MQITETINYLKKIIKKISGKFLPKFGGKTNCPMPREVEPDTDMLPPSGGIGMLAPKPCELANRPPVDWPTKVAVPPGDADDSPVGVSSAQISVEINFNLRAFNSNEFE